METNRFLDSAPGRLVPIGDGCHAFVPDPLPPELDLSGLALSMYEAVEALGELKGVGHMLVDPNLFVRPFLYGEAVLSSKIEGTTSDVRQLVLFEAESEDEAETPQRADAREVFNYVRALNYGLGRLDELPVCLRLIREVHAILLESVRGQDKRPGEFRTIQNYIGHRNRPIEEARFIPPPVREMGQCLHDLEAFINSPQPKLPFLVKLALIHYQFEAVHPFVDGNGRIGRLLNMLLLCAAGGLPQPLLYLSAYFERNRTEYMDRLLEVSRSGDWSGWVNFFLVGVRDQSRDSVARARRLIDLHHSYRESMQEKRATALLLQLTDNLFRRPAFTIQQASQILSCSVPGAQKVVNRLLEAGMLIEATGRKRDRVYLAHEVLQVFEGEPGRTRGRPV